MIGELVSDPGASRKGLDLVAKEFGVRWVTQESIEASAGCVGNCEYSWCVVGVWTGDGVTSWVLGGVIEFGKSENKP